MQKMDFFKVVWIIFLVFLASNLYMVQGFRKMAQVEEMELEKRLNLINKPAIKSFKTNYGDILDCIEIDKQLAFDNPLLKNHSIQMQPSSAIQRLVWPSSRMNTSQMEFNNITCPKGTVIVKRVQKEDLLMEKFSQMFAMKFEYNGSNDQVQPGHEVAIAEYGAKNIGIHSVHNVWGFQVAVDQFSSSTVYVANYANSIAAGWSVNPHLRSNTIRFFVYWTKDSGKRTGCFNMLCPGFVHISKKFPVGLVIKPLSIYGGQQYEIALNIVKDDVTGNWWVQFQGDNIGYYPKELFTSLTHGATVGGWGGEVYSPTIKPLPIMGNGHFPEEKFGKACFIRDMMLLDPYHTPIKADNNKVKKIVSLPRCYRRLCDRWGEEVGNCGIMYFGGPPNCLWQG